MSKPCSAAIVAAVIWAGSLAVGRETAARRLSQAQAVGDAKMLVKRRAQLGVGKDLSCGVDHPLRPLPARTLPDRADTRPKKPSNG